MLQYQVAILVEIRCANLFRSPLLRAWNFCFSHARAFGQ